jgi:hypothetical protein
MDDTAKGAIDVVTDTVEDTIDAVLDRVRTGLGWRTIDSVKMQAPIEGT